MQDAIFITPRKAKSIRNQVINTAMRNGIKGDARVVPHYEHRCLKGYKVRFQGKDGHGFNIKEEMVH